MRNLMLVLIATFSVCLTSCGDDDKKDEPNSTHQLTGYWVGYYYGDQVAFQFNEDGTGSLYDQTEEWFETFSNYMVENGHLFLFLEDDGEYYDIGSIRVKSNTFDLNLYDDGDWITFTRQR